MRAEIPSTGRRWTLLGAAVSVAVLAAVLAGWSHGLLGIGPAAGNVDPVFLFLLAIAVVLLVAHLFGSIFARLGQPPVLGEILAGIALGPSVLGAVWPAGRDWIFPTAVQHVFAMISQLGLVVFAFLIGCELRTAQLRTRRRVVVGVVAGGMGLPMVTGIALAVLARPVLAIPGTSPVAYALFVGLALSITALPVLARVLGDLKVDGTPLGTLAMASAAVGDGIGWLLLAVITVIAGTGGTGRLPMTMELMVAFVAFAVLAVRPALRHIVRRADAAGSTQLLLPVLFGGALVFGATTQLIGLHAASGAFLFGALVPKDSGQVVRLNQQMQTFTIKILLPVFFVGVGLDVSLSQLSGAPTRWLVFAGLLVAAFATKIIGAGGGARLAGCDRAQARTIGVLMNCRGVTELIVVTIGWQEHLFNSVAFTCFVIIALVTSLVTPWLAHAPRVGESEAARFAGHQVWQLLPEHAEQVPDHDR